MIKRKSIGKKTRKPKRFAILLDIILILVGIYLITLDAIPSMLLQTEDPELYQIGRIIRLGLGILITIIGIIALRVNLFDKGMKK